MSEHEFSETHNAIFTALNSNMLRATIILCLSGIIALMLGILDTGAFDIISGITVLCIGVSLYFPTDNFKNIVTTTGEDIKELLQAFSELDKGWLIVNIVTLIYALTKIVRVFHNF